MASISASRLGRDLLKWAKSKAQPARVDQRALLAGVLV